MIFHYHIIRHTGHSFTNDIDTTITHIDSNKRFLIRKPSGQPILSQ